MPIKNINELKDALSKETVYIPLMSKAAAEFNCDTVEGMDGHTVSLEELAKIFKVDINKMVPPDELRTPTEEAIARIYFARKEIIDTIKKAFTVEQLNNMLFFSEQNAIICSGIPFILDEEQPELVKAHLDPYGYGNFDHFSIKNKDVYDKYFIPELNACYGPLFYQKQCFDAVKQAYENAGRKFENKDSLVRKFFGDIIINAQSMHESKLWMGDNPALVAAKGAAGLEVFDWGFDANVSSVYEPWNPDDKPLFDSLFAWDRLKQPRGLIQTMDYFRKKDKDTYYSMLVWPAMYHFVQHISPDLPDNQPVKIPGVKQETKKGTTGANTGLAYPRSFFSDGAQSKESKVSEKHELGKHFWYRKSMVGNTSEYNENIAARSGGPVPALSSAITGSGRTP